MGSDTDALHNLAAAIADGSKVDWDHVEGALSPEEQRLLKQLRLIAMIAGAHQSHDAPLEPTGGSQRPLSETTREQADPVGDRPEGEPLSQPSRTTRASG